MATNLKMSVQGKYYYRDENLERLRYNPRRKKNRETANQSYNTLVPVDFPLNVIIEPTNYCNMMCQMCLRNVMTRKQGIMQWEIFCKIIDECAANGTYSISLYMLGDPLIHSRIRAMAHYAKMMGIPYVDISTNGMIDMTVLLGTALDEIIISLDGIDNTTYNENRQGDYQKIEDNINNLINAKTEGKYEYPLIRLQIIEMDSTKPYLGSFVEKWSDKVDVIYIKKLEGMVQGLGDKLISDGDVSKINFDRNPCKQLFYTHSITWDGDHSYCCHDPKGVTTIGNVENMSIRDAWKSETRIQEIERQNNNIFQGVCEHCVDWDFW